MVAAAAVTPWLPVFYEIGNIILWMNETYQDIQNIPAEILVFHDYFGELTACLETLKRVCLPDGTETLHPNDIKTIIPISKQATEKMRIVLQIISSSAEASEKERSHWESFCELFSKPEWMQQKSTVERHLQAVKQKIEAISIITAANTHQKVCDMQQQIEEMKQMMIRGLEARGSSRNTASSRILSAAGSQGSNWSRNRRKTKFVPSNTVSAQQTHLRTELESTLANLVDTTDGYLWYG